MNRERDKKEQERFFLERFLEQIGVVPTLIVDREGPDFLIELEGRNIGIEVTHLHIRDTAEGPLAQAVESVTTRIVVEARQLYTASGAPPAQATVIFDSWIRPEKINRTLVARQLAELIQGMCLKTWERKIWRSNEEANDHHPLMGSVTVVHTLGVPDQGMGHWTASQAVWVAPLTPERLQTRITEKSAKINAYQEAAHENWLLVVADGMKPSQAFSVPPDFATGQVSSPFERTFFYRYPDGEVIEVGIQTS